MKLLIANRGEIAVRVSQAAMDLDIETVSIHSSDDATSLHTQVTSESFQLSGNGVSAYLDIDAILKVAEQTGCDAIHPGYGFLSESAAFSRACEQANIEFIGPAPNTLKLFGEKSSSRLFAQELGINVPRGLDKTISLKDAENFFKSLPKGRSVLLKAVHGGGGRGMRQVHSLEELAPAFERATSEANAAFGNGELYIEELLTKTRHIELQVIGDGCGFAEVLGDRDCSLQRRHQKIVEIAPAPELSDETRSKLWEEAEKLARESSYRSLLTVEFLYSGGDHYFIEANARIQVEHTITEESIGIDLVQTQLRMAQGEPLKELIADRLTQPRFAIQTRINTERMNEDGSTAPTGGTLTEFQPPTGPNIRVDTYGYQGYRTNPSFDSLLAKVICAGPTLQATLNRSRSALSRFHIVGVDTNKRFLEELLLDPKLANCDYHTRYIDEVIPQIVEKVKLTDQASQELDKANLAGVQLKSKDPLAVLTHGKTGEFSTPNIEEESISDTTPVPSGTVAIRAPMQGTVIELSVSDGETLSANQIVAIMEAMKMEHEIRAGRNGTVHSINVIVGDAVYEDHALIFVEESSELAESEETETTVNLEELRSDVAEVLERHEITLDKNRPDAIEKRRRTDQRTARENIDDLCDEGSFVEHGQLALTPGTGLPLEEVIRKFPTDGMVTGIGSINGDFFGQDKSRSVVMAYDYTVLAGTQGAINHPKTDRMLELAERWQIPVVLFAEGGGGRAGTGGKRSGGRSTTNAGQGRDDAVHRPLDTPTFASMGRLSGLVPLIGITSRYCFAGNASLLGCCDVIIATENSNIGMGGPALIEGGNLGVFRPEEVGPIDIQSKNGVVDVVVKDESEAVATAKQYLSYFQGSIDQWECEDQRLLRHIIPENRLRVYNVRDVIQTLADSGSVLEIRRDFGLGMVTAFIRIEGRPIGVIANNPMHLSGAIDSDGSDNAARFLQLCDGFDIPVLVLCDTPGMMVGPEIEKTALVRHCSRLFVIGANLTVPVVNIVLRKAYGLGAQAMAGGSFKDPFATVAWPTAEFGGMGLEGQVKLGFRNELEAIEDPTERTARYDALVEAAYQRGKALVAGTSFAVDDVIDPADSRRWITKSFDAAPLPERREGKKRRNIDTW